MTHQAYRENIKTHPFVMEIRNLGSNRDNAKEFLDSYTGWKAGDGWRQSSDWKGHQVKIAPIDGELQGVGIYVFFKEDLGYLPLRRKRWVNTEESNDGAIQENPMTPKQKEWLDQHQDYRVLPTITGGLVVYVDRGVLHPDGSFTKLRRRTQSIDAGTGAFGVGKIEVRLPGQVATPK